MIIEKNFCKFEAESRAEKMQKCLDNLVKQNRCSLTTNRFLLWDILLIKKFEIKKTKPTIVISTFKTDVIIVGLVFSISNFFNNKISQGRNQFMAYRKCLQQQFSYYEASDAGRWNFFWVPVVKGGQNLLPLVGIGLTDLQNIGGATGPLGPPSSGITGPSDINKTKLAHDIV